MTGLPRAELLRIPLTQLFRSDSDDGLTHLQWALHTTQTFHSQEGYFLRRGTNGTWIPVNLTLTRLHTERGQLGLVLARDVTERVQAEEQLRSANAELEHRVQEKTADLVRANEALRAEIAERAGAQEALREREELYRLLTENSYDLIYLVDLEGRIVYTSPSVGRLLGRVPTHKFEVVHPDDIGAGQRYWERILAGAAELFNVRVRAGDGSWRWLEVWSSLVRYQGRSLVLSVCRDVTERKSAEETLQVSERRYRLLFERNMAGVLRNTPDGAILEHNEAFARILGYGPKDNLSDRNVGDLYFRPADRPALLARLRTERSLSNSEVCFRRRDGTPVWVLANIVLYEDAHGREIVQGTVVDITERKRAEDALRQVQERLAHVLASSPAVLFTLAVTGNEIRGISWISDNLRDMLGQTPTDAYREGWWLENVHPEDLPALVARTREELFSQGHIAHEYRFRHGDGSYRWTRGEIRLIRDPAGRPTEAVGSWSDVTERKQIEEQFRQAQKMEAIGRLAGGVAHDFNNLLTIINGYGELLLGGLPTGDPNRELVREVVTAGERAMGLTRQLLAFSRKAVIEPRVLDLQVVVADVDRMLRRIVGEDISLAVVVDPEAGAIKADAGQVEQVILNLVVNARDAMPRGGRITIEVRNAELDEAYARICPDALPGPHVLLAVSDTGCGMDQATIARVFEPFFTTKGERGTGLGLATVHGIVKQAGGHVGVYSEVGRGTTFKVYLPRVQKQRSGSVSHRIRVPLPAGSETLLLVEDDDGVRALTRHILRGCGYTVLEAHDGIEAIRLAGEHTGRIDLVVTDVVLPRMGGREVAERLSALRPGIKVLFLSGYTDDAVVRHGILEAQVAFLQKPFTPGSLAAKVREVLDTTT
jgi:two-component system, cell cycle sensor histidine kinase and response regulator CckA